MRQRRGLTAAQLADEIQRHRPLTDWAPGSASSFGDRIGLTEVIVDAPGYGTFQVREVHLRSGVVVVEVAPLPISDEEDRQRG